MIRFIGDVHGNYQSYLALINRVEYSIQVGDLGLNYEPLRKKENIDWSKHKAIAGNHDCYEENSSEYFSKQPMFLENYGHFTLDNKGIFYVRGAWSIDWRQRQEYNLFNSEAIWWEDEELSCQELEIAIDLYKQIKPEIVVTHECPSSIVQFVTNPLFTHAFGYDRSVIETNTNITLQRMLDYHKPERWFFGHYHCKKELILDRTIFRCLDQINPNISKDKQDYYDYV